MKACLAGFAYYRSASVSREIQFNRYLSTYCEQGHVLAVASKNKSDVAEI